MKDAILRHIQSYYDGGYDIAKSLRDGTKLDLSSSEPRRVISQATDEKVRAIEQDGFNIKFELRYKEWMERSQKLEDGMKQSYTFIFDTYCNKTIQDRIEQHPEYDSKIQDNPIELLEVIKTLMHDPVRAQYPLASMHEAVIRLINIKQYEGEALLEYVKRFKQCRDAMKNYAKKNIVYGFVENTDDYKQATSEAERKRLREEEFDKYMAYLLLKGSDQSKYNSLCRGLASQYALGNNQYPKDIQAATDILSSHRFDASYRDKASKGKDWSTKDKSSSKDGAKTSFAQARGDVTCYVCGKKGHMSPQCYLKDTIPKEKWHQPRKSVSAHQKPSKDQDDSLISESDEESDAGSVGSRQSTTNKSSKSGKKKHVSYLQRHSDRRSGTRGFQGFITTVNAKEETERGILKAAVYKQRAAARSVVMS